MATFLERLAFIQKVPTLMKATADDENPCPGYLFQEIGKISHESSGCGQCLLEYLLERLQVESCHVKLKVLKIFVHLCGHGSQHFLTELRRNSTFIQQASVYSGPPDPIHGTALYQKVRSTAQGVAKLLFTDTLSKKSTVLPCPPPSQTLGMGSASPYRSGMQGFGYSPGKQGTGVSDSLLDKIQKAAEVVASAVLPPTEQQGIRLHDNRYRAVLAPATPVEVAMPACAFNLPLQSAKGTQRRPGQVGGGWEETDNNGSSQDNTVNSRTSGERSSKSGGTGSQSGASRESSGDLSERLEAMQLGDCSQEMALIGRLVEGSRVFLSREESQHFIKECSTLNCEVVVELLSRRLQEPSHSAQMRALCAIACLMTSDLLSLEQIFGATQRRLAQLSEGPPGPVANKATKLLRQFEAMMGGLGHSSKQVTAIGGHFVSAVRPSPTTAYPLTSALALSADTPDVERVPQPSRDPTRPQSPHPPTSDPSDRDDQDDGRDKVSLHPNGEIQPLGTGEAEVPCAQEGPEVTLPGGSSPAPSEQLPCCGRLSLFSGMELVTRARTLTRTENLRSATELTVQAIAVVSDNSTADESGCADNPGDAGPLAWSVVSEGSQAASAFSFLNC